MNIQIYIYIYNSIYVYIYGPLCKIYLTMRGGTLAYPFEHDLRL